MIISEITLSYPCLKYNVEVSHFTSRKSTAIEWVILETINRCESLQNYASIPIAMFFEQIFTITDADLLIRPCLIDLYDIGAISIPGIDNETELSAVPLGNLKLTKTGKEMQAKGLLPGTTAEDTFTIYYDLISRTIREDSVLYKEKATGIEVMKADEIEDVEFPFSKIREWLFSVKETKRNNKMNWLTPTTNIHDITPIEYNVLWKNVAKKIDLSYGMQWRILDEENEAFNEISLMETDFYFPEGMRDFPKLNIVNPDDEINLFLPVTEVNTFVMDYLHKDNLFCVDERYFSEVRVDKFHKPKSLRIGLVFGADSFKVVSKGKQLIIYIPDKIDHNILYGNVNTVVQAGIITVYAGSTAKDIAVAYIPKEIEFDLTDELLSVIERYYEQENSILFVLFEIGLKELFNDYVQRLVKKEENLGKKVEIIDLFNAKSIAYYNKKIISALGKERLIVDVEYIRSRCKSLDEAITIIDEYSSVNSLRNDEVLIQRVVQIVLETIGELNDANDIWDLWSAVEKINKSYINWINKSGLYKGVYSNNSISWLLMQFGNDELFEVKEYTFVEQTILNMKRICIRIQELLPDFNIYSLASEERYNEILINHMDNLSDLYEQIRQWKDEEEKFCNRITDLDNVASLGSVFTNIKTNINGLRSELSRFYDDRFMNYKKIFIVDTCALMHEPGLISWFDGENILLVIPMVVLDELDVKKSSNDEVEASSAREAIRNINNYKMYEWLNIGENSYQDLLSDDLDKERNDNKILSIALRYTVKKPVVITDDINFRNIIEAHKIGSISVDSYKAMKKHEKLIQKSNKKKNNKKKK